MLSPRSPMIFSALRCGPLGGFHIKLVFHQEQVVREFDGETAVIMSRTRSLPEDVAVEDGLPLPWLNSTGVEVESTEPWRRLRAIWQQWRCGAPESDIKRALAELLTGLEDEDRSWARVD